MLDEITPFAYQFWTRVRETEGGCWVWTAGLTRGGYGHFQPTWRGRQWRAHRFSWVLANGPIPAGLDVCHTCDNPPCVRPDHLFLGTRLTNHRDMVAKGRGLRGEGLPAAKLTSAAARWIRERYRAGGVSQQSLAAEFGVTQHTIWMLLEGRTWREA